MSQKRSGRTLKVRLALVSYLLAAAELKCRDMVGAYNVRVCLNEFSSVLNIPRRAAANVFADCGLRSKRVVAVDLVVGSLLESCGGCVLPPSLHARLVGRLRSYRARIAEQRRIVSGLAAPLPVQKQLPRGRSVAC